jgi:hypothetical protein
VGMAVPALLLMYDDRDPDVRNLVRATLGHADRRLGGLLRTCLKRC